MITKSSRILILGHRGMVGSAVLRLLRNTGYRTLFFASRSELDLREKQQVDQYFAQVRPDAVVMAAGQVRSRVSEDPDFALWENLAMGRNVIDAADRYDVGRFVFVASCDPKWSPSLRPVTELALLETELEERNRGYSLAKILCAKEIEALHQQCRTPFVALLPSTLYGPGDRYDVGKHSLLRSLMLQFARSVSLGSKSVRVTLPDCVPREYLFIDDFARACLVLLERDCGQATLNVGSGVTASLAQMVRYLGEAAGVKGNLELVETSIDRTFGPSPILDSGRIRSLGWQPDVSIKVGMKRLYEDYCEGVNWVSQLESPLLTLDAPNDAVSLGISGASVRSRFLGR